MAVTDGNERAKRARAIAGSPKCHFGANCVSSATQVYTRETMTELMMSKPKGRIGRLLVFLGLTWLLGFTGLVRAAEAKGVQRTAVASRAVDGIKIDGIPNEPAWAAAKWHSDFFVADGEEDKAKALKLSQVQTRFKVLFDDDAFYVAVECDEPMSEKIRAATPWRDGALWQDDCVEIFFDPENEGRCYHQVIVNSQGKIYDSYSSDYGLIHSRLWNGAFRAAGHVDHNARKWGVEIKIPFGAIVLGEDAGGDWKFNVTRERHAGGRLELTSWAPLQRNFHQPKLFGTLTGLPKDYSMFRFPTEEPKVDVSRSAGGVVTLNMSLKVRNETSADRRVTSVAALFEDERSRVETEPIFVPKRKEANLIFPPLRLVTSVPNTDVVFSILDADTKRLLKAVVKNLSTEYHPITVKVLRPCYRNNIYATEKLPEIVVQVSLSAEVRHACVEVSLKLTNEAGKPVAFKRVPPSAIVKPLRLKADNLPVGRYVLTVSAIGRSGGQEAKAEVTLRKLPPPPVGNEVRIDENRNLLVNGKPLFSIGWYGSVHTEDPRADVVALQNVQTPLVVIMKGLSGLRRAFEKHGIYSIVSVENGRLYYSFNLWQPGKEALRHVTEELRTLTEPSEDVKRLVKELVEAVRGEPGLLGYYIADEPEIQNVRSEYLENYYRWLCELDPYHPVFVTNNTIDGIVTHGYKCADVLNPDPYSPEWDYVPNFLKRVNEVAYHGKSTYVTLWHGSEQAHFTHKYGTAPPYPYRVLRNQYFASIAYGAKGFTAYTSPFFMHEIEYRYGLPYIWRELRFLEKAILSPQPKTPVIVEGATDLATWAREVDGRVYLVIVHHKTGNRQVRVLWSPLKRVRKLYVLSEGREVAVRDGAFQDEFAEGDVHIYTDDPAARAFPKVTEVQKELERRRKEAIKPGNLLHWTKGTKVHCSKGYYAPWFHQFYYYAINGITDDMGWSAYAWDRKSAWIELTLKEPADLGRVLLYTPNIRDYQLDFVAPGGQVSRVKVTGNEQTVVTHNFKPPVPCLKLRLTVTAVREKAPLLSEIEAYTEPGQGPITPIERVEAACGEALEVLFGIEGTPNALWVEDFKDFQTAPRYYWDERDTKWVLNTETFRAKPNRGGGITVTSVSPKGYDSMSRFFPYDLACRFFQVKLSRIEGKGYQFTHVGFSDGSGKPGYRGAINTARTGIYTIDTHYIHENFRTGKHKRCFITVTVARPEFTFDWLRLVRRPIDGLVVTLANGAPLPHAVGAGDALHFELHLEKPAQDAVVEVLVGPSYTPLAINGQPYIQLWRADERGCVWVGRVALGAETGKFTPERYPVVFKASIVGGNIVETYASAFVAFK